MKASIQGLAPALENYDLEVTSAIEIAHGFNRHYRILTSEGEKHLIIYRTQPGHPPRDLSFQTRQHLRDERFLWTPRTVPTISGTPYCKTALGTVALIDWVPGEVGSRLGVWPLDLVRQAAHMLADLHRHLVDFRPKPPPPDSLSPLYLPADAWIAQTPDLLEEFQEWAEEPSAVINYASRLLTKAVGLFDPDDYKRLLRDRPTVVHGDFRPSNLVVDSGSVKAVLDFDSAFWESRLYDLAYGCFHFTGAGAMAPQDHIEPARTFVQAYVERWPLSDPERRLFPFFVRHVVLKRLLSGWDLGRRLELLEQLEGDLGQALLEAI